MKTTSVPVFKPLLSIATNSNSSSVPISSIESINSTNNTNNINNNQQQQQSYYRKYYSLFFLFLLLSIFYVLYASNEEIIISNKVRIGSLLDNVSTRNVSLSSSETIITTTTKTFINNNDSNEKVSTFFNRDDVMNSSTELVSTVPTEDASDNKNDKYEDTFKSYDEYDDDVIFEDVDEWGNNTKLGSPPYIETIEVLYNNLQYRKVCTSVGVSSILCMIVRFPFQVQIQQTKDPTIRYPSPVTQEFYNLTKDAVYTLSLDDWITCKQQQQHSINNNNSAFNENDKPNYIDIDIENDDKQLVQDCLMNQSQIRMNLFPTKGEFVTVLWTRQLLGTNSTTGSNDIANNRTIVHGIGHESALERVYNFFGHDHEVLLSGASPSPMVTEGLRPLFKYAYCSDTNVFRKPNYNCRHPNYPFGTKVPAQVEQQTSFIQAAAVTTTNGTSSSASDINSTDNNVRHLAASTQTSNLVPFENLTEGYINVANFDYRLLIGGNSQHHLDPMTTLESVLKSVKRPVGYTGLRNMSVLVEYPFAHTQSQDMFQNGLTNNAIRGFQYTIPSHYVEFMSRRGKNKLAKRNGYNFRHLIVFDGIPQFYPTVTNGWTVNMYQVKKEMGNAPETFKYKGWKADYGKNCVGPLPSNSQLREMMLMARNNFFRQAGYQYMSRWYGRTWEFINLFWFQLRMYTGPSGLDCTHSAVWGGEGISGVHKYFLQAMIDDYYENQ